MTDIDRDEFQSIGSVASGIVDGIAGERLWTGETITEPGVWSGVSISDYHGKRDLLDGPSVSKSGLKHIFPLHGGSPKAFWGRWAWNPDHIKPKTTPALDFGKAVHCLLLGDEVFEESFVIRPEKYPDYRSKEAREWRDAMEEIGKTILTDDQIERIRRIADDASKHPLVHTGILNGRVERSMFAKDPSTGIWLRARPDAVPVDGVFVDLKTASSFSEDFLERQMADAGYYLQAGMTKMICDLLGLPFETFVFFYVLNDDVPDTAHVEIHEADIERGVQMIRWALDTIAECLERGEWPGARPFNDGTRRLQMRPWVKDQIDRFIQIEHERNAA